MADHDFSFGYQPGQEIGYDQITGNVTVSSATEATGTTVSSPAPPTSSTALLSSLSSAVAAFRNAADGTINAGAGGTAVYSPAFVRFTKV